VKGMEGRFFAVSGRAACTFLEVVA